MTELISAPPVMTRFSENLMESGEYYAPVVHVLKLKKWELLTAVYDESVVIAN